MVLEADSLPPDANGRNALVTRSGTRRTLTGQGIRLRSDGSLDPG